MSTPENNVGLSKARSICHEEMRALIDQNACIRKILAALLIIHYNPRLKTTLKFIDFRIENVEYYKSNKNEQII